MIATHDPNETLLGVEQGVKQRAAPCIHLLGCPADQPQHLFGTDGNVRDVFSRVVHGARMSLTIGFATVGFAIVVGGAIGAIAGFSAAGRTTSLMRLMDVMLAFPALLLAIAIVTAAGPSLVNALLAIGIVSIPIYARVMRASVLRARRSRTSSPRRARSASPASASCPADPAQLADAAHRRGTLGIGGAVLEIAALSFVGLRRPAPQPEWGSMIGLERNQCSPRRTSSSSRASRITLTVLAFNLLGDGLRDALDPRLNR